jgi:hypothetical protein
MLFVFAALLAIVAAQCNVEGLTYSFMDGGMSPHFRSFRLLLFRHHDVPDFRCCGGRLGPRSFEHG